MLPLPEGKASQKYCTLGMGASGPCVGMLVYITSPVQAKPTSLEWVSTYRARICLLSSIRG